MRARPVGLHATRVSSLQNENYLACPLPLPLLHRMRTARRRWTTSCRRRRRRSLTASKRSLSIRGAWAQGIESSKATNKMFSFRAR